jgi:hypothetical protein
MSEHDFEPIRGLPGELPPGEDILWQGAPNWLTLAQNAFHIRAVAAYFAVMLVWRAGVAVAKGEAPLRAVEAAAMVTPLALLALGILAFFAWLNSATTVYTVTNRRVVMRFGAAIPKAINIPFTIIEGAAMKSLSGGNGDLALTLKAPNKIAFLNLWPHARPWRVAAPQPTFRAIPDAAAAAAILASVLGDEAGFKPARVESATRTIQSIPAPLVGPQSAAA